MATPRSALVTAAMDALLEAMSQNYRDHFMGNEMKLVTPKLSGYHVTTLRRITSHPWTPITSSRVVTQIADNMWDELATSDYMAVALSLDPINGHPLTLGHIQVMTMYSGLHPYENEGECPEERVSQIIALFHVADNLQANGKNRESKYIEDIDLRKFLLHPGIRYKREDIVDIIRTHNIHDVQHIKDMLDFEVRSMTSGVL